MADIDVRRFTTSIVSSGAAPTLVIKPIDDLIRHSLPLSRPPAPRQASHQSLGPGGRHGRRIKVAGCKLSPDGLAAAN